MAALPTELWLIIIDIVIEEGIIRVDQCDHIKFPYIQSALSTTRLRYHFYDSYYRLRQVCRSFNAILGDPPSQILLPSSTFPLSASIRAVLLDLDTWATADFQHLSAEMLSCRRLVYLDVKCGLIPGSVSPNLSDFLRACAGRALHDVQRLTLRIVKSMNSSKEEGFWDSLHNAFPLLVTLVITGVNHNGGYVVLKAASNVVSFAYLEIIYVGGRIVYTGCRFPRLRHASIWDHPYDGPGIVTGSPHLESLLIRSPYNNPVDLSPYSRLRLLGIHSENCHYVNSMGSDHPLEHLWVITHARLGTSKSLRASLTSLPRVLRITIEIPSFISPQWRTQITREFQGIKFGFIGMNMRPPVNGDNILVIERSPASVGV